MIGATLAVADGEDPATAVDAGFALADFAPDVGVHAACGELPTGVRFTAGGEYATEDASGETAGVVAGVALAGAARPHAGRRYRHRALDRHRIEAGSPCRCL